MVKAGQQALKNLHRRAAARLGRAANVVDAQGKAASEGITSG